MTDVVSVNSVTGDCFVFFPRPLPCSFELCIIIGRPARGTEKNRLINSRTLTMTCGGER